MPISKCSTRSSVKPKTEPCSSADNSDTESQQPGEDDTLSETSDNENTSLMHSRAARSASNASSISSRASHKVTCESSENHNENIRTDIKEEEELEYDSDCDSTGIPDEREMGIMYQNLGQAVIHRAHNIKPYMVGMFNVSIVYLCWITLHFITAQLYVRYCAHYSFYGFLLSPFLISAPHCVAMRWVFARGGTLIDGMWIILGTWLCSNMINRTTM